MLDKPFYLVDPLVFYKSSYVTAWNTHQGYVRKRLRGEKDVRALTLCQDLTKSSDSDLIVVMAKGKNELRVWHPGSQMPVQKVKGYPNLEITPDAKLYSLKDGRRVVLYSKDISVWDVLKLTCVAVFTSDVALRCMTLAKDNSRVVCGVHDQYGLLSLSLYKDGKDVLEKEDKIETS